jgi:hypothetical protein
MPDKNPAYITLTIFQQSKEMQIGTSFQGNGISRPSILSVSLLDSLSLSPFLLRSSPYKKWYDSGEKINNDNNNNNDRVKTTCKLLRKRLVIRDYRMMNGVVMAKNKPSQASRELGISGRNQKENVR